MEHVPAREIAEVFDFDKTLAATHKPSPNGMTVEKAYALALDELFVADGLLERIGGVRNRAPSQLVRDVIECDCDAMQRAFTYYENNALRLMDLVPSGKGVALVPLDSDVEVVPLLTEVCVRLKLSHLLAEIGCYGDRIWPEPCPGADHRLREKGRRGEPFGVISSGHDAFIQKTFALWGVPQAAVSVTDDDLRGRSDVKESMRVKPHPFLITHFVAEASQLRYTLATPLRYYGDDEEKDGKLVAGNPEITFCWYNPDGRPNPPHADHTWHVFSDWQLADRSVG